MAEGASPVYRFGPFVLDVLVPYQEHVLPMIPAGATVKDIIKS